MGLRFRKSLRILPGVRLNISKSGVSASLGGRGATLNISKRGLRPTVGIPGTGLSYSEQIGGKRRGRKRAALPPEAGPEPDTQAEPVALPDEDNQRTLGASLLRRVFGRLLGGR